MRRTQRILACILTAALLLGMIQVSPRQVLANTVTADGYTVYTGRLTTVGAQVVGNASQLYLKGDAGLDAYKLGQDEDWQTRLYTVDGTDNGIFLNGTKVSAGGFFKYYNPSNFWFAEGFTANAGDVLTIKGRFRNDTQKAEIVIEECSFVWDGVAWEDKPEDTEYIQMTLQKKEVVAGADKEFWDLRLTPSNPLPSTGKYENLEVSINGTSLDTGLINTLEDGGDFLVRLWGPLTNYVEPKLGDTITIKAGRIKSNVDSTVGIELTRDFSVTWDGSEWKEAVVDNVEYTSLTLEKKSVSSGVGFPCWDFRLKASAPLPASGRYEDFEVYINDTLLDAGNLETLEDGGDLLVKLWGPLTNNVDPQVNDKVVIKAGKVKSTVDSTVGIELTQDYTATWDGNTWVDRIIEYTVYNGKLTTVGSEAAGTRSQIYLKGSDGLADYKVNVGDWSVRLYPLSGEDNGVFLNGEKVSGALPLLKYNDASNYWFAEGFEANVGDKVTIKGRFRNDAQEAEIVLEENTFVWDGTKWEDEKTETVSYTQITFEKKGVSAGADKEFWDFRLIPSVPLPAAGMYENLEVSINDTLLESGNINMLEDGGDFLVRIWGPLTNYKDPQINDKVTIKAGSIKNVADPTVGIQLMEDYSATWDGATWVDREIVYTDYAGKLTTIGNETTGNASQLYLKGDVGLDSYKVGGNDVWTVKLYAAGGEENGLFLNGVKLTSASLLKYNDRDNFWFAEGFTAAVGDTLTIKGAFRNDTQEAQVTLEESVFVWDGSAWKDQKDDVETDYTAMNLERVALSGTGERWVFWLEPSVPLPAGGRYEDFAVYINDTLITPESLETMNEDGRLLLVVWGPLTNGVLPKEGDKVTIKAGKVQNIENPSVGIELENDFVITWDGASWLLPNQQVRYQEVSFSGINENGTRFVDGDFPAWHMYLTPDDRLPGVPDSLGAPGTYFSGLKLSVNGRETDVVIYHASFENTAFMVIPAELLPENITTDTRVILKAGKAGSSDGSDGIWLKQDLVIYANRYGMSLEGFLKPAEIIQENARLELDRGTAYGGNENGIYLNTNDKFPVDTTWATNIRAVTYDANSGVFLNGQKVNAVLKRYGDGKLYVGLADAGLAAKDKDQVTIRGMFALNGVSVSYAEVSFYYNGKTWGTTYTEAPPETYTQFKAESVNMVTAYDSQNRRWNVYLNINNILPGDIDKISFEGLSVEIGGKLYPVYTAHSYQHTLYLFIDDSILPADSKNGTKVTLKAGKALAADRSTGIQLLEDFSFYTFMGTMSERIPTDETTWQEASVLRMNQTACFNKESRTWPFHLKLSRVPEGIETGTYYYQFPIEVDGKTHRVNVMLDGEFLFFNVPESVLPENAGTAVISIAAGAEALANAGYDGIRITEDWKAYLYNGEISERKFEGMETVEANIVGLQNASEDVQMYHLYLRLNKEIPGTEWYEQYRDFVYEYNGQTIMATAVKAGSSDGKTLYIPVEFSKIGRKAQEGDLITIRPNTVATCGGYQFTILNEFTMMYSDGLWTRYVETDVEAPEDIGSLWSIARFDPGYIPTTTDGSVLFSNEDKYNVITSTEDLKDFTIRFKVKKFYDDELVPPIALVLRGKPISEDEEMSRTLLYGYGITFSALEVQNDSENPEAGSTWTQYIELWKNGENGSLLDQYRISYVYDKTDHPFFQYDEEYEYEISIYNITETCVCILVKVNDKLVMRYYDEAGSDVLDPAVNGGKFAVYAACPTYITDDVVELDAVIAAREECEIGDEVRIAATYPSVLEGAEFSVDEDGATVSDGVFVATKAGTYTVSGAYNGKQLTPVQITVAEKQEENIVTEQEETEDGFPWIFVGAAGGAVVIAAVVVSVVLSVKHKKKKQQAKES